MQYREISGTFGNVDGSVSFAEGLNVILAPNESGKSTLCALLRTTLYGLPTGERSRTGKLAAKTRFLPWSGRPFQGKLTLEKQGKRITVSRWGTKNMNQFSATYEDTALAVPGLESDSAGEKLTGVPEEVFRNTVFCTAEQLAVTESNAMEQRITAMAGSGDEEISAGAVLDILGQWRNQRYLNKSNGRIPEVDRALAEIDHEIAQIEHINAEMIAASAGKTELEQRKARLEQDLVCFERRQSRELAEKIAQANRLREESLEIANAFRQEHGLHGKRGNIQFCMQAAEQFRAAKLAETEVIRAEAEAVRVENEDHILPKDLLAFQNADGAYAMEIARTIRREAEDRLSAKPLYVLALIAAVLGGLGVFLRGLNYEVKLAGLVLPLLCWGFAVALLVGFVASWGYASRQQKRGRNLLEKHDVDCPADLDSLAQRYVQFLADEREWKVRREKARQTLERARFTLEDCREQAEQMARQLQLSWPAQGVAEAETLIRLNQTFDKLSAKAEQDAARADALAELQVPSDTEPDPTEPVPERTWYATREETLSALGETARQLTQLELREAEAQGQLRHFRDMGQLRGEHYALETERRQLVLELEAIDLARQTVTEATDRLSACLTPKLCARTAQLFHRMTGGKYEAMEINKNFMATLMGKGDLTPRNMQFLSCGALDQLYLSMRIALSEVLFGEDLPPLVLDDALNAFDDTRAAQTIALLAELAQTRQIIFLTCRNREAEVAVAHGGVRVCLPNG